MSSQNPRQTLPLTNWEVGFTSDPSIEPVEWIPARVPGNVQLDWARARGWPPYWVGENFRDYAWMEDVHWVYRVQLPDEAMENPSVWDLVLEGVDYVHRVACADWATEVHEGMFRPHILDLEGMTTPEIRVIVGPPPKNGGDRGRPPRPVSWFKPGVNYGWDFCPRLVPTGIWRPAYLTYTGTPRLDEVEIECRLGLAANPSAEISVFWNLETPTGFPSEAADYRVEWTLSDPQGEVIHRDECAPEDDQEYFFFELDNPELWWPHDLGAQPLYTSTLTLKSATGEVVDQVQKRIGVRQVRLVPHPEGWVDRNPLPKGPQEPPMTLEINGKPIFAKGSNWVPPEIFMGECGTDRMRELLELAKDAHMNLLRVWGGGIINPPEFFDLCDEMGLMVWQEFPMACALYSDDPDFIAVLELDAIHQVKTLRHHPSLVMWCGGNELYNSWSRMTEQSLALRALNSICYEFDRDRPFLMTSPIMGVGHGDYRLRNTQGLEVHQIFQNSRCTAYCEFGVSGPSSAELLREIVPAGEAWPPKPGTTWESHHAFLSWDGDPESWLMISTITDYLGEPRDLDDLVEKGQWLQAQGLKEIYEEARRQKPRCSMALNWCLNEPWPNAANNSIIEWPARPKPAYHAVKEALRPAIASARVPRFRWDGSQEFRAELWVLNDAEEPVQPGIVTAHLEWEGGSQAPVDWDFRGTPPFENAQGPTFATDIAEIPNGRFYLVLQVQGHPELGSRYGYVKAAP